MGDIRSFFPLKNDVSYFSTKTYIVGTQYKHFTEVVLLSTYPASILRKSTSGRHRPVSYPDGPMTARYRFT